MYWTWDANKAAANLKKHKVSFGVAERVFDDPFAVTNPDPHPHEERWQTIGRPSADKPVVLLVVHTWPDDEDTEGRIISARKAEPRERKLYEER
jgi:uncharacterized protein